MSLEITMLKPEEYEEMMKFLETSYRISKGYFSRRYPHVWRKDTIQYENRLILKRNGRIVSHVGIFPLTMKIDNVEVKMGGIGGVATLQEYRGLGYMTKLMNYAIKKMKDEKYPLSILWGDRQRYGHFGYEIVGKKVLFTVSLRSLSVEAKPSEINIVRYRGEKELLDKIIKLHEQEPIIIKRTIRDNKLLYNIPGLIVYVGEVNGNSAYIVFESDDPPRTIIEYGGKPDVLISLLYTILKILDKELNISSVDVEAPYYSYETFHEMFKVFSSWKIRSQAMVKILNLKELLENYLPIIARRTEEIKYELMLGIRETGEKVKLTLDHGTVVIEPRGKAKTKILLSERDMAKLLFDGPETVSPYFPMLNLLFPLPLHVGTLNHI